MLFRTQVVVLLALVVMGWSSALNAQCELQEFVGSDSMDGIFPGGDRFGGSLAVDGSTAVIGAGNRGGGATFFGAGGAYVFELQDAQWVEVAILESSDLDEDDEFGTVAICGDTIVVAATHDDEGGQDAGAAYVFVKPPGGWPGITVTVTETAKLLASDATAQDIFGIAVSISGDTVVVGSINVDDAGADSGAAYVFVQPAGGWVDTTETAKLTASDASAGDRLGTTIEIDGDTVIVGADQLGNGGRGAAYIFEKPMGGWVSTTEIAKLTASDGSSGDRFGFDSTIRGDLVAVGAFANDAVFTDDGAVYIFVKPAGGWIDGTETAKLTASDGVAGDLLGIGISIGEEEKVITGANGIGNGGIGAAYLFEKPMGGWIDTNETLKVVPSDGQPGDRFGSAVGITDGFVLVGTTRHMNRKGGVYSYAISGDCDQNGEVDICEILANPSLDIDQNGILDSCEACPCDLFTATAFEPPMGKKKKIGSTLPIKFCLFFDGVEIVSDAQLNQILADNGCTPGCPQLLIFLEDDVIGLPLDDVDDNVGDPDEGDCFRYSAPNWIYNVRLLPPAFMPHSCYSVEIEVGDCVLVPDNNVFETK